MKLIPLTRGKFTKVDDEDFDFLNQWKWCARKAPHTYYAVRCIGRKPQSPITIRMHRVIMDEINPKVLIDHKDGDGLNNQKFNLRKANSSQNSSNRTKRVPASSKYLGVHFRKNENKWQAKIRHNKQYISLGYFDNEVDAAIAYNAGAKKYHGEFANINIINLIVP